MDVQMAPQDAGMARSFWLILSPLLIESDVYRPRVPRASRDGPAREVSQEILMDADVCLRNLPPNEN